MGSGKKTVAIQVKFFASLRESVGLEELEVDAESVAVLRECLSSRLGLEVLGLLQAEGVQLAINQRFMSEDWRTSDALIPSNAEVAFLPRVTGG